MAAVGGRDDCGVVAVGSDGSLIFFDVSARERWEENM